MNHEPYSLHEITRVWVRSKVFQGALGASKWLPLPVSRRHAQNTWFLMIEKERHLCSCIDGIKRATTLRIIFRKSGHSYLQNISWLRKDRQTDRHIFTYMSFHLHNETMLVNSVRTDSHLWISTCTPGTDSRQGTGGRKVCMQAAGEDFAHWDRESQAGTDPEFRLGQPRIVAIFHFYVKFPQPFSDQKIHPVCEMKCFFDVISSDFMIDTKTEQW